MLVFLGIAQSLLTVLPRYMTFGSQFFLENNIKVPCSLVNFTPENCTMSISSSFFNKIALSIPLFSPCVFLLNWVFLSVFLTSAVKAFYAEPESPFEECVDEDNEDSRFLP